METKRQTTKKEDSPVVARLKDFVRSKGMTMKAFEQSVNYANGYFNSTPLSMPKAFERIIKVYPELNIGWLVTGKGSMTWGEEPVPTIPLVNIHALGGPLSEQLDAEYVQSLRRVPTPVYGAQMAIDLSGDSMEPVYTSGSRLYCARIDEPEFIEWGKVYLLDTTSGAVVKEIQPGSESSLKCCSFNKRYAPFEIQKTSIRSIWKILGSFSLS